MNNKTETFLEYKALLFSVAYNMLGMIEDAEDIVQETYIKWMELPADKVQYIKAYLVKIVTNKCINYLESARARREEYVGVWLPEPLTNAETDRSFNLIDSYHALSIGVLKMLEKLNPMERAIFILREVFVYDYMELADIFDKTEDNCRQIYKRAKDNLGNNNKRFNVDKQAHKKMLENFIRAFANGTIEDLIGLFKEDIVLYADGGGKSVAINGLRLTAALKPIYGSRNVSNFISHVIAKVLENVPDFTREMVMMNGMPSLVSYRGQIPLSALSFEMEGDKMAGIYIQTNPDKLQRFVKRLPPAH